MADNFHCILVTPEQELFNGEVTYVQVPAHDGQLGVMHGRAPLLAELGYGKLRLDLPGGDSVIYTVAGGFFKVNDNKLSILTDEARKPDQIDATEARSSLEEALAMETKTVTQQKRRESEVARARALLTGAGEPAIAS